MQNFTQSGDVVTLAAPYDCASGAGALVGNLFGVAASAVLSGADGQFHTTGVFGLAKPSTQVWTKGQKIHWDNTNKQATTDGSLGPCIGTASEPAANPSATGYVRLGGSAAAAAGDTAASTLAATGSAQGDAAQLPVAGFVLVTAADGTKGVKLPAAAAGRTVHVKNSAAAILKVYPPTGGVINALAANAAISLAASVPAIFTCYDGTTWYTTPLLPS